MRTFALAHVYILDRLGDRRPPTDDELTRAIEDAKARALQALGNRAEFHGQATEVFGSDLTLEHDPYLGYTLRGIVTVQTT